MEAEVLLQRDDMSRKILIELMSKNPILVSTNNWFKAKDGQDYKTVWGRAIILPVSGLLGFEPGGQSVNWLLIMGSGEDTLIIGGCQIHYIQICPEEPLGNTILKLK